MRKKWGLRDDGLSRGLCVAVGRSGHIASLNPKESVRDALSAGTRDAHDRLDQLMRRTGWQTQSAYAQFLQVQYAARQPVETCFARLANRGDAPPAMAGSIARDLDQMNSPLPTEKLTRFELPEGSNPIGAFWAIAGSSLGNKAILREVELASGAMSWPSSFLADISMIQFWKRLRQELNLEGTRPTTIGAVQAANAVFDHFQRTATQLVHEAAA